jgi:hypothetical protein
VLNRGKQETWYNAGEMFESQVEWLISRTPETHDRYRGFTNWTDSSDVMAF